MRWEGRFSSLKMPQGVACGTIVVDHVDINTEGYETHAVVKYTGVFRKGKVVNVSVIIKGMVMKINLGEGREVVFTINTKTDTMVQGSYVVGKVDKGQFYLQPEGSPPIENQQSCVIS